MRDIEVHIMGGVLTKGGEDGAVLFGDKGGAKGQRGHVSSDACWSGKLSRLPGVSSVMSDVQHCLNICLGVQCQAFCCNPGSLLGDGMEFPDKGEGERIALSLPGIAPVASRIKQATWLCRSSWRGLGFIP